MYSTVSPILSLYLSYLLLSLFFGLFSSRSCVHVTTGFVVVVVAVVCFSCIVCLRVFAMLKLSGKASRSSTGGLSALRCCSLNRNADVQRPIRAQPFQKLPPDWLTASQNSAGPIAWCCREWWAGFQIKTKPARENDIWNQPNWMFLICPIAFQESWRSRPFTKHCANGTNLSQLNWWFRKKLFTWLEVNPSSFTRTLLEF